MAQENIGADEALFLAAIFEPVKVGSGFAACLFNLFKGYEKESGRS